ncbi:DNA-binding response regulator [Longimycelium tulufanense]|uniref:DNA-binding response regulator n=1 Tax=Longimycelium tulufanense TaxID=907463 RepID=A0A8J3CET4_9PSEU|nr:response regulator transcription factor [Longimycelium tulufanense]GGM83836.1 DNA-binding response regulator [Longimycelium tulufanense]
MILDARPNVPEQVEYVTGIRNVLTEVLRLQTRTLELLATLPGAAPRSVRPEEIKLPVRRESHEAPPTRPQPPRTEPVPDMGGLTPRELDVLSALAAGSSNRQIARGLGISERTVKAHVRAIFAKLEVTSRTEAAVRALRYGLVLNNRPKPDSAA